MTSAQTRRMGLVGVVVVGVGSVVEVVVELGSVGVGVVVVPDNTP